MPNTAELAPAEPIPSPEPGPAPKPVRRDFLTRITPETARKMNLAARKARAERAKLKLNPPPAPKPDPAPFPLIDNAELELVQKQITRIEQQLLEDMEPTERAQLVRALDLMLDRKRMILMIPGPGTYRPTAQPKASRIQSLLGPDTE